MGEIFNQDITFEQLGLTGNVFKGVQDAGFVHPTLIQAELIPRILAGKDVLGQAKTGTGKTAAFGLPIMQLADLDVPMQALILAPTRELATQIDAELADLGKHTGVKSVCIVGGESMRKQLSDVKNGAHIIVGTPGRIMDMHGRRMIHFDNVRWAVLDEVDRMLDIGFRDDIRDILSRIKGAHQTIFVSATISTEIERLGRRFMKPDAEKITTVSDSLTVSLVTQKHIPVQHWDKRRLLLHLLTHEEPAMTVVFCRMKGTVRDVARYLKEKGVDAREIHGDLAQSKRTRVMNSLRSGSLSVLVASDLAARGLDVDGITHVINYDLPDDPEVYIHRIGRTARAGRTGTAWSFVEPSQGQLLTEIEKLAGTLIEKLEYPDFKPAEPPSHVKHEMESEQAKLQDRKTRWEQTLHEVDPVETPDPKLFPGGIAPKGPAKKTLGSRFRTGRSR